MSREFNCPASYVDFVGENYDRKPLPDGCMIEITLSDGEVIQIEAFQRTGEGPSIEVKCRGTGIHVHPRAGNCTSVSARR